ncbi:MAG: hypothetical protein K6E50_07225 [Lachnospiraceae bacterium]|nr:hypothetical protein [Lachnospiraceae bacterium]
MIEKIDNTIQLAGLLLCFALSLVQLIRKRNMTWELMSLFYGGFLFGELYWLLYLLLYDETPRFITPDMAWYVSYLFLFLALQYLSGERFFKFRPVYALIPVFTVGMCVFFMQWGDYVSNILAAGFMTALIYRAGRGLDERRKSGVRDHYRTLCLLTLLYCALEYALWIISCFWMGDSLLNPYFWVDLILTVILVAIFFTVLKLEMQKEEKESAV